MDQPEFKNPENSEKNEEENEDEKKNDEGAPPGSPKIELDPLEEMERKRILFEEMLDIATARTSVEPKEARKTQISSPKKSHNRHSARQSPDFRFRLGPNSGSPDLKRANPTAMSPKQKDFQKTRISSSPNVKHMVNKPGSALLPRENERSFEKQRLGFVKGNTRLDLKPKLNIGSRSRIRLPRSSSLNRCTSPEGSESPGNSEPPKQEPNSENQIKQPDSQPDSLQLDPQPDSLQLNPQQKDEKDPQQLHAQLPPPLDIQQPDTEQSSTTEQPDSQSDTEQPDTQQPDTEQPDTQQPDTEQPEIEKPDIEQPDTQQPDPQQLDPQQPDTQQPDPQQPDPQQPDPQQPDPQQPDPQQPDLQQPDLQQPDLQQSDPQQSNPQQLDTEQENPNTKSPNRETEEKKFVTAPRFHDRNTAHSEMQVSSESFAGVRSRADRGSSIHPPRAISMSPKLGKLSLSGSSLAIGTRGNQNLPTNEETQPASFEWRIQRQKLFEEILYKEEMFVFSLLFMKHVFFSPLTKHSRLNDEDRTLLITPHDDILALHTKLHTQLKEKKKWWGSNRSGIMDIVHLLTDRLSLYLQYCQKLPNALNLMKELKVTAQYADFFATLNFGSSSALGSTSSSLTTEQELVFHFMSPIYHVWRWHAVVRDLDEITPSEHADTAAQKKALDLFKKAEPVFLKHYIHISKMSSLHNVSSALTGEKFFTDFRASVINARPGSSLSFGAEQNKSHRWREREFTSATWCSFCRGLIVVGKHHVMKCTSCQDCGLIVHKHCKEKMPPRCGQLDQMRESLLQQNRLFLREGNMFYTLEDKTEAQAAALKKGEELREESASSSSSGKCDLSARLLLFSDCILCLCPRRGRFFRKKETEELKDDSEIRKWEVLFKINFFSRSRMSEMSISTEVETTSLVLIGPREGDQLRRHLLTFSNTSEMYSWYEEILQALRDNKQQAQTQTNPDDPNALDDDDGYVSPEEEDEPENLVVGEGTSLPRTKSWMMKQMDLIDEEEKNKKKWPFGLNWKKKEKKLRDGEKQDNDKSSDLALTKSVKGFHLPFLIRDPTLGTISGDHFLTYCSESVGLLRFLCRYRHIYEFHQRLQLEFGDSPIALPKPPHELPEGLPHLDYCRRMERYLNGVCKLEGLTELGMFHEFITSK